jgi:hypothetical protein
MISNNTPTAHDTLPPHHYSATSGNGAAVTEDSIGDSKAATDNALTTPCTDKNPGSKALITIDQNGQIIYH